MSMNFMIRDFVDKTAKGHYETLGSFLIAQPGRKTLRWERIEFDDKIFVIEKTDQMSIQDA